MPPRIQPRGGSTTIKKVGEIRRSQIVSTYGSGAIVDFPRLSGIMTGLDKWNISDGRLPYDARIQENNLQKMLGKDFFVQVSTDENADKPFSIPVYRFPRYYYCPECHELDIYSKIRKTDNRNTTEYNKSLYCGKCKTPDGKPVTLIPSRFIVACPNGHIDDFPYSWWVHRGTDKLCDKPQLSLNYIGNTGGLDGIVIKCNCGASKSMSGCMDKNALGSYKCKGNMPWLGFDENNKPWYKDPENCNATMRTMQRSANNVYYPITQSALTIPPMSSKIQDRIKRNDEAFKTIFDLNNPELEEQALLSHFNRNEEYYRCGYEKFKKEVYLKYKDVDSRIIDEEALRIDEYSAFCDIDWQEEEDHFRTRSTEVPEELENYIEEIKIVSRLREVKVIRGFRRIDPSYENDPLIRSEKGLFDREFTPLSRQEYNWLPAIQMFGEGIFIRFKESTVAKWESYNKDRYSILATRNEGYWTGRNMFDINHPRYILLHTIAHLLIRQFTAQCGYESASLREKIYSTFCNSKEKMCGILIYTSATDSDGSLGGLAREGDGFRLANTIYTMLENATWCSNDPICVDSKGQGYKGLNFAACHACGLLPETSCEAANCLLDRASVVGTPENRAIGFFSGLL
ncbi:DUF1998 domain-containing protein [Oribacterium sp. FC2011]|uniref:DUF1998 domain-containing protein n=1 Tax=Oribacterium sp. FC2011 TaxID=1408311 RepID=UPI0004E18091|nr:DUF1998 domain-containing protein [Oribacterium sp. FC2011]